MKSLTIVFMIASTMNLSACVSWPILGSGGAAENSATTASMDKLGKSVTPEQGLFLN